MSEKTEKKEQFPIEFPSRNGNIKHTPIVDNTEFTEQINTEQGDSNRHIADKVNLTPDLITEIVATDIDTESIEKTMF